MSENQLNGTPQTGTRPASATPAPTTPPVNGAPPAGGKKRRRSYDVERIRNIVSTLAIIIIAPLVALALTAFVFQSYQVDGPSMETTLMNNDRLIVYKLPKTIADITGHPYIPHRGDIIVFSKRGLDAANPNQSKQLIKRVIGLPGDHLVIANGMVMIYNKKHPKGFDPDKTMSYGKYLPATTGNENIVIPKNEVFVMGDNRTDSYDSRDFGPIKVQNIIGKLVLRILPINKAQVF